MAHITIPSYVEVDTQHRSFVMRHVKIKLGDNPMVYVGYVDDAAGGYDSGNSWDVVQPLKVGDGMAIVAACVDACSMIHSHDAHGASIKMTD